LAENCFDKAFILVKIYCNFFSKSVAFLCCSQRW